MQQNHPLHPFSCPCGRLCCRENRSSTLGILALPFMLRVGLAMPRTSLSRIYNLGQALWDCVKYLSNSDVW